ncbi:MAG: hypothetical protein AB7O24_08865 [Kofleriaceae bacterium]
MDAALHSEVVTSPQIHARRAATLIAGCTLAGVGFVFGLAANRAPSIPAVSIAAAPLMPASERVVQLQTEPPAPARTMELALVFEAGGGSYVKLADLSTGPDDAHRQVVPPHDPFALIDRDGGAAVIGHIPDSDVPAIYRSWKGRTVVVDGTCTATVTEFAVVSRLIGDTGYADVPDGKGWDVDSVMRNGGAMLAAKLDRCTGSYARDAALSPVAVPVAIENRALVAKAKAALLASQPAKAIQREWIELGNTGKWHTDAELIARVLRHPTTGATFVSIQSKVDNECGGVSDNAWGLYRVEAGNTITPVTVRRLGEVSTIEQLIDVDSDGSFEILGQSWLGLDTLYTTAAGELIEQLRVPFYGCPC